MIGSSIVSSRHTSSTADATLVIASPATKRDSNQSNRSPRSSIHCSEPTAIVSRTIPSTSTDVAFTWYAASRTYVHTR